MAAFGRVQCFSLARPKDCYEDCYSEHDVIRHSSVEHVQKDLEHYLSCFDFSIRTIRGDRAAIERMAYEACEDKFNDGVMYIEFRYGPHLLKSDSVSLADAVTSVESGFKRAERILNAKRDTSLPPFKAVHILCGIWSLPDWLPEVIDVALQLDPQHDFIAGVDLAGAYPQSPTWRTDMEAQGYAAQFRRAREHGLGVTIHAGECVGADSVEWAIEECNANRIGHGYRVTEDSDMAARYLPKDASETRHMEFCPRSSILTAAQPLG